MDHKELIERLRSFHAKTTYDAADAIKSLLAENERLKHNLTSTEQTMREYQELAAKRLEEITKYRDAHVVAWKITFQSPDTPDGLLNVHYHGTNAIADYLQVDSNATVEPLIVKPGEEK